MSWKQTKTWAAAYEGVEATVMFTDEWADTHQPGLGEGSSGNIGDILPNLTLNSSEVSS